MKYKEKIEEKIAKIKEDKKLIATLKVICFFFMGWLTSGFLQISFRPHKDFLSLLYYGLFTKLGFILTIILFILFFSLSILSKRRKDINVILETEHDGERNYTRSELGTKGTARFMPLYKIKDLYNLFKPNSKYDGFILGKIPDTKEFEKDKGKIVVRSEKKMKERHESNRNTFIIGSPGTMKSAGVMIPNILSCGQRGESMFVTDPKGELCDYCSPYLKELGYEVRVFNLVRPWASDGWNFMDWLSKQGAEQEQWVNTVSRMIITNTGGEESDSFWDTTAEILLKAVISLVLEITAPVEVIKTKRIKEYEKEIEKLRNEREELVSLNKIHEKNQEISRLITSKYVYIKQLAETLSRKKKETNSPDEQDRINKSVDEIYLYMHDQQLVENFEGIKIKDYEPLTVAELKYRLCNFATCLDVLYLTIDPPPDSNADSFNKLFEDDKSGKSARNRLLYELAFQIPSDSRVFEALTQAFAICNSNTSIASKYYNNFQEAQPSVRTSVKTGTIARISAFNQRDIRNATSSNEIDLELPGKKPCAYFCIISDQERSLSYISSLFITLAFSTLQTYADNRPTKMLDVLTYFFLDEFSNIGVIPDFTTRLSTLRSRDIHIIMAIQNIPQLDDRYGENLRNEIASNCSTLLFLGSGLEDVTPTLISVLLGVTTTTTEGIRRTKHKLSPIEDMEVTYQDTEGERSLMTMDEIMRLKKEELIVFTSGQLPMKLEKTPWFLADNYLYLQGLIAKYPKMSGEPRKRADIFDLNKIEKLINNRTNGYDEQDIAEMESLLTGVPTKKTNDENELEPSDYFAEWSNPSTETVMQKEDEQVRKRKLSVSTQSTTHMSEVGNVKKRKGKESRKRDISNL